MPDTDRLADEPFRFVAAKAGSVMIYADGRVAKTLKGREAARFLSKAEGATEADLQLLMARVTREFKFGNEHRSSSKSR